MSDVQRHHMLHGQQGTTDLTKKYSPTSPHHHQYQNIPHHPLQNIHSPSPTSINNNLQQLDPPDIQTSAEIAGRRRNGSVDRGSPLCQQMHQQPNLLQHAATLQRNTSGQNEPQFTRDNTDFHAHTLDTRSIQRPLDPRTLETRFIDTRSIDSRHLDSRESDKHRELSQRLLSETPVLLQDRGVTATATLDRHGGSYSPSSLQYHRLSQQDLCHSQLTITPQTATTQPVTPETMVPINSLTDLGILGYQEGSNEALNSLTSKKQHPNGSTRPYGMPISGGSIGNNRYSTSHRINSSSSSCHSSLDAIVRSSTKCCSSCGCCKVFISLMMCMLIFAAVVVSLYFFIRYAPYQKRPVAEKEARDPCSLHPCQFGAICVPTGADNSPTCRCPDHCADEEPPDGSTEQFCGSDGHNYPTECQMNIAACRMQRPIVARHRGPCDPCDTLKCPVSQVCQVSQDRKPRCNCEDTCSSEVEPVCASDGNTYLNKCYMKLEGCRSQRNLDIIYIGACDRGENPCSSAACLLEEVCNVDSFGIARCECPPPCQPIVRPVCGSDNLTYDNHCELKRAACKRQLEIVPQFGGMCDSGSACHGYTCHHGSLCVERQGIPVCECPVCPGYLDPVCGSDGLSYNNECLLRAEACTRRRRIDVQYRGRCRGCEDVHCRYNSVCEAPVVGRGHCVCPTACDKAESPVCGTDGVTYVSECQLKVTACQQQRDIKVATIGDCDLCKHVECKYGARCEAGQCLCPTACPDTREPVCGTNGVTYLNECTMQRMACTSGLPTLRAAFFGECSEARSSGVRMQQGRPHGYEGKVDDINKGITTLEGTIVFPVVPVPPHILEEPPTPPPDPCLIMNCEFGSNCVILEDGLPRCSCTLNCSVEDRPTEPVCASDLKMYPSECAMNREACQRQVELRLRPLELCEDYELVPCNGGTPLVNPSTGRDYYCGEGPDKELCPHGSYCHWSLSFAKCCPLDNDTTDVYPEEVGCRASQYLCCPDGVTDAKGDNFAGCPSICQCHKLGAYEDTCDPVTNQCRCKPGVGGTKCDRCEPGFWGLPMIQRGSDGCLPCGCSLFGSVRDDCEQMTGQCVCKPGIGGKKCNMCPDGLTLGPRGCQPESIHATPAPSSCDELECYFGARCHKQAGHVECVCDAQCPADSSNVTPVCGSDGETYGSECHLKLFACRYQKDVVMDRLGPCNMPAAPMATQPGREDTKTTRHILGQVQDHGQYPSGFPAISQHVGPGFQDIDQDDTHALYSRVNLYGRRQQHKPDDWIHWNSSRESNPWDQPGVIQPSPSAATRITYPSQPWDILSTQPAQTTSKGDLGSHCTADRDCAVPYSLCNAWLCICRDGYRQIDQHNCMVNTPDHEAARMNPCLRDPCHGGGTCTPLSGGGFSCQCTDDKTGPLCESHSKPPYDTPAFQGDSYLEIKKIKAYNKVQIEIEFRSFSPNGILLYTQQQHDGQGDYLSLAVVDGFIEFRYNLGSGSVVIRSHQKITPRRFHRVVAKRYQKDGILQVDSSEDAIGKAPGHLKSLDLRGSTYIGYVPGAAPRVWENTGTTDGLVGCIKSIRINGRPLDLVWPGSAHLISASMISECQSSPCYDLPCLNRGACRPATDLGPPGFKCLCAQGYSGDRCEVRDDPCSGGPCMEGGTCVPLPDQGFMCQCPPGRSGLLCDVVDRSLREIVVPEFDGDSYLELPTLENVGTSFAIEVWFMTHSPDGLLLYNGQGSGGGDFVAVNLRRGHLEFVYNLGSGHTTLVSKEAVELDKWHVARVRRKKRRGTLRLDKGSRIKGKSGAKMTQLNLNQKLYLGGMMNYSMAHPDSGVCCGLAGAIQRLVVNKQVIEDLPTRATSGKGVRRYRGTPCLPNLCLHGGVCEPFLDRFLCKCPAEYTGLYCDTRINGAASDSNKPVSMDGSSFLHFPDLLMFKSSRKGRLTNHFQVKFRTTSEEGLLLWLGSNVGNGGKSPDYLAVAVVEGMVELSFRLGGKDHKFFSVRSKVRVTDGEWHTAVIHRRKKLGVLRVDRESPVKGVLDERGSATLDVDDNLYVGGLPHTPSFLPNAYQTGFRGCLDELQVQSRVLDLSSSSGPNGHVKYCDNM